MNCEFCGIKESKYRCPNCGTCVCDKHTNKQIGSKIGAGLFLLIPSAFIFMVAQGYVDIPNEPLMKIGIIVLIAGGLAELMYGQKCLKCEEKLKEL
jgi:uncharacterized UBP type Zn finger protein